MTLQQTIPLQITHGAVLRYDGVGIGLVAGGAPAWDLRDIDERAALGKQYHRLLLAHHGALSILLVDQPVFVTGVLTSLYARQHQTNHSIHSQIIGSIAAQLSAIASQPMSQKQVIWCLTVQPTMADKTETPPASSRWQRWVKTRARREAQPPRHAATLAAAALAARRFADTLRGFDGFSAAAPLSAEAIARLWWQQLDPIRAQRVPLRGALLERLREVLVLPERHGDEPT